MKIKDKWAVLECPQCKKRSYYHLGSFERPENMDKFEYAGFTKEDLDCYKCSVEKYEVAYEQWSAEDVAEIFGNEFEDNNQHKLVSMPQKLLSALNKSSLPAETYHAEIMRLFMEEMITDDN